MIVPAVDDVAKVEKTQGTSSSLVKVADAAEELNLACIVLYHDNAISPWLRMARTGWGHGIDFLASPAVPSRSARSSSSAT